MRTREEMVVSNKKSLLGRNDGEDTAGETERGVSSRPIRGAEEQRWRRFDVDSRSEWHRSSDSCECPSSVSGNVLLLFRSSDSPPNKQPPQLQEPISKVLQERRIVSRHQRLKKI